MAFHREDLFQLIASKDWDAIAKLLYKNSAILDADPIIQRAIQLFEDEFFSSTGRMSARAKLKLFEYPGLVIDLKASTFSRSFVDRFVDEKLAILRELNSDLLLNYALSHQDRPLAKEIIREVEERRPEEIADELRQNVSIKSTRNRAGVAAGTKLFKSRQEENFFEAVRRAFPTYHPYPNVALSTVINFDAIKGSLTAEQRNYFFRAIVDSVVFDGNKGYQPIYFFELDSHFHDEPRAQSNDKMKDAIFEAANTKLIRIRAEEIEEASVDRFYGLVIEVMRNL